MKNNERNETNETNDETASKRKMEDGTKRC